VPLREFASRIRLWARLRVAPNRLDYLAMNWKLAEAKNKLSELVRRALTEGPQRIERRRDAVVVVSAEEFDRLCGRKTGFKDFLLRGPDLSELDLERDRSPMRDAEL